MKIFQFLWQQTVFRNKLGIILYSFVQTSFNFNISIFTPIFTPWILYQPIIFTTRFFCSPSNSHNRMISTIIIIAMLANRKMKIQLLYYFTLSAIRNNGSVALPWQNAKCKCKFANKQCWSPDIRLSKIRIYLDHLTDQKSMPQIRISE